jgi:hypothetical protein
MLPIGMGDIAILGQPVEEGRGPPCRPRRSAARRAGSNQHAVPPWTKLATSTGAALRIRARFPPVPAGSRSACAGCRPPDRRARSSPQPTRLSRAASGTGPVAAAEKTAPGSSPTPACRAPLTKASPRQGGGSFSQACGTPGAPSSSSGPRNPASTACRRASSSRCSAMIVSSRPSSISRVTISAVCAGALRSPDPPVPPRRRGGPPVDAHVDKPVM